MVPAAFPREVRGSAIALSLLGLSAVSHIPERLESLCSSDLTVALWGEHQATFLRAEEDKPQTSSSFPRTTGWQEAELGTRICLSSEHSSLPAKRLSV